MTELIGERKKVKINLFESLESPQSQVAVQDRAPAQRQAAPKINLFAADEAAQEATPQASASSATPSRFERLIPNIEGFSERPRTDSIAENAKRDVVEYWEGFKALGSYIANNQDGVLSAVGTVAKQLPAAIANSYIRWGAAAKQGRFLEMMKDHPVEFVQDFAAPVAILFSGGAAGVTKVFGTGATAAKVAGALNKMATIANVADVVSDPIGGTASVALQKTVGAALRAAKTPPLPKQRMPIDIDPEVAKVPLIEQLDTAWERIKTGAIDANNPIQMAARKAEVAKVKAATGVDIPTRRVPDTPVEELTRTFAGIERKMDATMERGFSSVDDLTQPLTRDAYNSITQEPATLKGVMETVGAANAPALRDYAVARRAVGDLAPKDPNLARGIDLAEADKIVREYDPRFHKDNPQFNPDVHDAWLKLRQFNADGMKYLQDGGIISAESRAFIEAANPNYVPWQRSDKIRVNLAPEQKALWGTTADSVDIALVNGKAEVSAGGSVIRPPRDIVKKLEGSLRMIQDPLAASGVQSARIVKEVELNKIVREFAKMADVPDSGIRRVEPPKGIGKSVTPDQISAALEGRGILEAAAKGQDVSVDAPSLFRPDDLPPGTIQYFEGGERKFLAVDDPDVAQAFASLRFKQDAPIDNFIARKVVDFGRPIAALQRAGVTLEPGFTLGLNMIRDGWTALTYSKYNFVPVYDNVRGLFHYFQKGEVFDAWARSGGMQAHLSAIDRPVLARRLQEYVSPKNAGYLRSIADSVRHPIQILQALQETSEASTRLGEFNRAIRSELKMQQGEGLNAAVARARSQGIDTEAAFRKAAVASRDVTVDFARRGADPLIRNWNAITAFQNAQIQSLDKFRRVMVEGTPKQRALAGIKAGLSVTLPSIFLHARLAGDAEYADLPQVERDLFWHVRMPEWVPELGGRLMRVPKPFEIGQLFGTLPVRALEDISGTDPDAMAKMAQRLGDFQPLGIPTLIKPLAEVAMDHSIFYDAPLTPPGTKRLIKTEQAFPTTSEFARILSKLGAFVGEPAPGQPKGIASIANLSPVEIDNIIFGYTGTLGRAATDLTNPVLRGARGGVGEAPAAKGGFLAKTPVINRLIANPKQTSQAVHDFWNTMQALDQVANTATSLEFDGNRAKFIQEHAQEIGGAKMFRAYAAKMFQLGKAKNAVESNPRTSGADKRAQLDQIDGEMKRIARDAMTRWREMEQRRAR